MNAKNQSPTAAQDRLRYFFKVVASLCFFNVTLIVVSFTSWFSGTAQRPGLADRIFGGFRFGGWRFDFFWLLISNLFLVVVLLFCLVSLKQRSARFAAILVLFELLAFCLLVKQSLTGGLLYMG